MTKETLMQLGVHDQKQAEKKNCSTTCESMVKLQIEKKTVIEPVKACQKQAEKETVKGPESMVKSNP